MTNRTIIHSLLIISTSILVLFLVDITSVLSYIYTLTLFAIIIHLVNDKNKKINFYHFHFYLTVAILIYLTQRYSIPNYIGLSGPEGGIGTDDVRFYAWLMGGNVPYPLRIDIYYIHPFAKFLSFIYPFNIQTPLNIIIINLLGISFLPFFTYKLAHILFNDEKIAILSRRLMLFCPFSLSIGLIIMRDMWIVTLIVAGLYYFLRKKYLYVILLAAIIIYIRFGSIIFLVFGIFIFSIHFLNKNIANKRLVKPIVLTMVLILFYGFYFLIPYLDVITQGRLSSGLFRIEMLSTLTNMDENATILKLISLPPFLRTIALTFFFYLLPFFNFDFTYNGAINIRSFLTSLSPIYLIFLWQPIFKVILNSFFSKFDEKNIKYLVWITIIFALCLGTVSLQTRHKTVMLPFLYIIAAYGFQLKTNRFNTLSKLITVVFILVQIIFLYKI